jgi:hypothetical protein
MPRAPRILLPHNVRTALQTFARAHATPPALALRARMVFRAADLDRPTHLKIGHEWGCSTLTVGQWRRRSLDVGLPGLQDAMRSGRPRALTPPTRGQVLAVASTLPQDRDRPVTRWTWEEIAATLLDALPTATVSRSRGWRILPAVARKPHNSASWLTRHDEDCEATAHPICPLYATALASYQPGRLVVCCDEQTGLPVLERPAPPQPAHPGRRERREQEDSRHGTRGLSTALAVATGQMAWTIGTTRQAPACVAHLPQASHRLPRLEREDGVRDNCNPPWRLDVCRWGASWCTGPLEPHKRKKAPQRRAFLRDPSHRQVLPCTPPHGAGLQQAAWCFGVLPRRFLARGSLSSTKAFVLRLERFVQDDQARHAHPYRWTDTGEPWGRDTPCSRTRRQHRRGRACFSPRPQRFDRLFYAPRPYRRQAA